LSLPDASAAPTASITAETAGGGQSPSSGEPATGQGGTAPATGGNAPLAGQAPSSGDSATGQGGTNALATGGNAGSGFGGSGISNGQTCGADGDCDSNHCVDGVCCESECRSQCQTCFGKGAVGRCTTLTGGQPVGAREPCVNAGSLCGGSCQGKPDCSYADSTVGCDKQSGCLDRVTRREGTACDGKGSCSVPQTRACQSPEVCNVNTDGDCGPPVFTSVSVSERHSCAVVSDATLRCWGSNDLGQLGIPGAVIQRTPGAVPDRQNAASVAAGWGNTCVLLRDGRVICWGTDYNGDSGCPNPAHVYGPMQCDTFPSGSGMVEIASGGEHGCSRKFDGSLQCWGRNDFGEVGDGTSGLPGSGLNPHRYTPVAVPGIRQAVAITVGVWHSCAALGTGSVLCWGNNDTGNLGTGDTKSYAVPTPVVGLDSAAGGAISVTAAAGHTCALMRDGSVSCFGDNALGQLGDGSTQASFVPVRVAGLGSVTAVAAGGHHTCAVVRSGSVVCWGRGTEGQLGQGALVSSETPVTVELPPNVAIRSIASKYHHTCALSDEGKIWCWGANGDGRLGDGTIENSDLPVAVPMPEAY
jgi:alpha-tubulin suppressor-like RCC1 family protein